MVIFWPILIYHTLQRTLCYEAFCIQYLPALLKGKKQKTSPQAGRKILQLLSQSWLHAVFIEYMYI